MREIVEIREELERVETELDELNREDKTDDYFDILNSRKWTLMWVLEEE